MQISVKDNVYT